MTILKILKLFFARIVQLLLAVLMDCGVKTAMVSGKRRIFRKSGGHGLVATQSAASVIGRGGAASDVTQQPLIHGKSGGPGFVVTQSAASVIGRITDQETDFLFKLADHGQTPLTPLALSSSC